MHYVTESAPFEMMGRLYTDIASIDRVLANKVSMRVKLHCSKDAFCLMGAANSNYRVHLEEVILYACRTDISRI